LAADRRAVAEIGGRRARRVHSLTDIWGAAAAIEDENDATGQVTDA